MATIDRFEDPNTESVLRPYSNPDVSIELRWLEQLRKVQKWFMTLLARGNSVIESRMIVEDREGTKKPTPCVIF
ncbi:hypothetical protein [Pandoraea sp. NPDC090278]|uniref:hypothetical protein n=1 Tax=Pandoraea sp. NPDC090278 TaxID=3364391 RepID=UPI00383AA9C4